LYAVGNFSNSGSTLLNHIGKWNGTAWQSVDDGFNDDAYCLDIYNDKLVVGGEFSGNPSNSASYSRIVSLEPSGFESLYVSEIDPFRIGYMSTVGDKLYFTTGRNGFSEFTQINGFVFESGTIKETFYNVGIEEAINYSGSTIISNLNRNDLILEYQFYQNSSIGSLLDNGHYTDMVSTDLINAEISCSASLFVHDPTFPDAIYDVGENEVIEGQSTLFAHSPIIVANVAFITSLMVFLQKCLFI